MADFDFVLVLPVVMPRRLRRCWRCCWCRSCAATAAALGVVSLIGLGDDRLVTLCRLWTTWRVDRPAWRPPSGWCASTGSACSSPSSC